MLGHGGIPLFPINSQTGLTESFLSSAAVLTARCSLGGKVVFCQGRVTSLLPAIDFGGLKQPGWKLDEEVRLLLVFVCLLLFFQRVLNMF